MKRRVWVVWYSGGEGDDPGPCCMGGLDEPVIHYTRANAQSECACWRDSTKDRHYTVRGATFTLDIDEPKARNRSK